MEPGDVAAVAELEARSFSTPWRAATFHRLLERSAVDLWVVEEEGRVVAYAVVWRVLDQAELANIAVREEARGRGLGARLLQHALDRARVAGVRTVYLEVRVSNEAARRMYRRAGFRETGRRRGYYTDPPEDALVLQLLMDGADA